MPTVVGAAVSTTAFKPTRDAAKTSLAIATYPASFRRAVMPQEI
jgi:hypothetical protein